MSEPSARWAPFLWTAGILAAAALLALGPLHGDCGFKFLLGAPCPGCGMTRSCVALLQGDVAESWRWHPLGIPAALAVAAVLGATLHEGLTGRPTFRRHADRAALPFGIALLVAFAGVWLVRVVIHPAWSPDPLRPGSAAERLLR